MIKSRRSRKQRDGWCWYEGPDVGAGAVVVAGRACFDTIRRCEKNKTKEQETN